MIENIKKTSKKIDDIKKNKTFKIIYNTIYYLLFVVVIIMLITVLIQRFSNNSLSLGGYRIFNIVTKSMEPEYLVGDVLLSKEVDPSELKIGDDIVYLGKKADFADKYITHRIINVEKNEKGTLNFYTKGIANEIGDPIIEQDQVKGIIVHKSFILSFVSKIIANLYSMYFIIFIPVAIIIFMNILRFSSEKNRGIDSKEE